MNLKTSAIPILGLVVAEFVSLLGNQIAAVAIPLLVLEFTQSPLAAGFAGAGSVLPILFAAVIGGKVIDKFGAVWASILADLMSFVSVLILPLVLIHVSGVSPGVIFLLVFIGALFDPTGVSARQALVPSLARLARASLVKINGYRGALENGADLFGPIIGTALIAFVGTVNTFFLNAISFLLCAVILYLSIPRKKRAVSSEDSQFLLGARFILANAQLRALAIVGMMANFVLLPFLGLLLPVLVMKQFENPVVLGVTLSVFGMAATLGALAFALLAERLSRSVIYYGGLVVTALSIAFCSLATSYYGVIVSAAFAGLLLGAGNPLEQTVLHELVPRQIAGQVLTSHHAIRFMAGPIGLLLAGLAVELSSVNLVLVIGAIILLVSSVIGWVIAPLRMKNVKCKM
jgi:MFS family permease